MDGWMNKHLQFRKKSLCHFTSNLLCVTCLLLFCMSPYYNMVPDWVLII